MGQMPTEKEAVEWLGHGMGLSKKDILLVKLRDGRVGRFKIKRVTYYRDPPDMWRADVVFRGYETGAEKP